MNNLETEDRIRLRQERPALAEVASTLARRETPTRTSQPKVDLLAEKAVSARQVGIAQYERKAIVIRPLLLAFALLLPLFSCIASDWAEHARIQNEQRAAFWREKGYDFNPEYMTAWAMDAKVRDIERSKHWAAQGYNFDPSHMTAWAMDTKVKDIERGKYWKAQGYDFNPDYMTAWAMDAKVKDIERSKYWKSLGYDFNPDYMTAWAMDAKVKDIERSKYWKARGYAFDPIYTTAWAMDATVEEGQHRENPAVALDSVKRDSHEVAEPPSSASKATPNIRPFVPPLGKPFIAENGTFYGEPNASGVPKTVYVNGYFRKDGTYVRSHYRSSPHR